MSKFHINKHGVPAPCRAQKGNCPLGGDESHFDTQEEAQVAADKINEQQHGILPGVSGRSEAHSHFESQMKEGNFKHVEENMVYHKAEDIEGAYNIIQNMRDKDGSINESYKSISEERKSLNSQLLEARKEIEKDLFENSEIGVEIREENEKIDKIEMALDKEGDSSGGGECPKCGEGKLVERNSKYGAFIGCSNFPKCKHTQKKVVPNPRLPAALESAQRNRQIKIQKLQAEALNVQSKESKSQELRNKLDETNKRFAIAEYANKYENPFVDPLYSNRNVSQKTPIEKYYEERKVADEKIESNIGKNRIALNSGKMNVGWGNTIDADLKVDKDGKINNLYIESEGSKGEINKVVKIHKSSEGNLELENGEKITMQYSTNWNMQRKSSPPQSWKLYTTEAEGSKYTGSKEIAMIERDSSD